VLTHRENFTELRTSGRQSKRKLPTQFTSPT
jgi:hypothetical protein